MIAGLLESGAIPDFGVGKSPTVGGRTGGKDAGPAGRGWNVRGVGAQLSDA
jgi:hypothetical protein